ncbi:MAG: hypothetical protein HRU15_13560, partial [Planctomycetes bacterium]|nr:hypothetical protein [Planctomycetota bacterium]
MNEKLYAIALGKFDALHLGHRALIQVAAEIAQPLLISFSGMAEILGWEKRAPLIVAEQRAQILSSWSHNNIAVSEEVIPFAEVRHLDPLAFIAYLQDRWQIAAVVTGEDFRFAYQRTGDVVALREIGMQQNFAVETVPAHCFCDQVVSSSRVRQAIDDGDMKVCHHLLDRHYRIIGHVVHGQKRGRGIGFPTANL